MKLVKAACGIAGILGLMGVLVLASVGWDSMRNAYRPRGERLREVVTVFNSDGALVGVVFLVEGMPLDYITSEGAHRLLVRESVDAADCVPHPAPIELAAPEMVF